MGPRSAGRATHAAEFESFHALIDARHKLTVLINGALMTRTPRNDAFARGTAQTHPPIAHDFMASAHGRKAWREVAEEAIKQIDDCNRQTSAPRPKLLGAGL
jgi:hypothetical protein